MKLFWRYASDAGTFTAGSTADGYSVANLQHSALAPGWKSDVLVAADSLTCDMGSTQAISAFALIGHNLTPGSDTVVLEGADDSAFSSGVVTIAATLTANSWFEYFSTQNKRYWRVVITKSAAGNQASAGRMVLGAYYTIPGLLRGYKFGPGADTSKAVVTRGGQTYGSLGAVSKVFQGSINNLTDAQMDEITELEIAYAKAMPFIVSLDWANKPVDKSLYGTIASVNPFTDFMVTKGIWKLSMREQQ